MARLSSLCSSSRRVATAVIAATLFCAGAHADSAAVPTPTSTPASKTAAAESCLTASRIRSTKVVDDRTVLFYLVQKQIYKNVLPYKCSLLSSYDAIIYKPTNNQLCSVDTIGPLDTNAPATSFTRCGLGMFEPIDKATADKLINDAKIRPKSSS